MYKKDIILNSLPASGHAACDPPVVCKPKRNQVRTTLIDSPIAFARGGGTALPTCDIGSMSTYVRHMKRSLDSHLDDEHP